MIIRHILNFDELILLLDPFIITVFLDIRYIYLENAKKLDDLWSPTPSQQYE